MAYLIAESCSRDKQYTWNNARFEYAIFLDDNGWYRTALGILKGLVPDLFSWGPGGEDNIDIWKVLRRYF